jgi:hypothetical protein
VQLRKFDETDWMLYAGAVGDPFIAEFESTLTHNIYVVIVDNYGLTISRYKEDFLSPEFVTIEMLPSQARALVSMIEPSFDVFDKLVDDAQIEPYSDKYELS